MGGKPAACCRMRPLHAPWQLRTAHMVSLSCQLGPFQARPSAPAQPRRGDAKICNGSRHGMSATQAPIQSRLRSLCIILKNVQHTVCRQSRQAPRSSRSASLARIQACLGLRSPVLTLRRT